jgi:hypothetical protein
MEKADGSFREIDVRHTNFSFILILALAPGLAACGKSTSSSAQQAQELAAGLTGDAKGAASDNPLCKMFTPDEIAAYGGTPVHAGANAAMGTACQWVGNSSSDDTGTVLLQIARAQDHVVPSGAVGFKKLGDVGIDGFVVPQLGGWNAAAIQGDKSINVQVSASGAAGEAKAVAFLREALKRTAGK